LLPLGLPLFFTSFGTTGFTRIPVLAANSASVRAVLFTDQPPSSTRIILNLSSLWMASQRQQEVGVLH